MKRHLILTATGTLAIATAAHADLTHVSAEPNIVFVDGNNYGVVQIIAHFDSSIDTISAVFGNDDIALMFDLSGSQLVNFGDNGGASAGDDDPGNHEYDSFVGFAGDQASLAAQKTPNFWGVPFGGLLTGVLDDGINGLSDNNSSYFVAGGVPVGAIDSQNEVVIAQFAWAPFGFQGHLEGSMTGGIQFNGAEQHHFDVEWKIEVPAPASLAMLAAAGIVRRRRNRG